MNSNDGPGIHSPFHKFPSMSRSKGCPAMPIAFAVGLRSQCCRWSPGCLLPAQEFSQHGWYAPLTNGDGLRYPLEIGPLTWHVVGSGIYPVKGSDG